MAVRPPLGVVLLIVPVFIRPLHLSASSTVTKCFCRQQSLAQSRGKEMAVSVKSCKEPKDRPHCVTGERW